MGSTAAGLWTKPLIESVVLPAHAQTSPGVTSSQVSSGGTAGSSGSGVTSGSGSGGGATGGSSPDPKLTMIPPSYTSDFLEGGACIENCDAEEMLLIVDLYDTQGILAGSYQSSAAITANECVPIEVSASTFGFSEWPENYMFVIGVMVPGCELEDSSSGFFTGIKDI